MRKHKKFKECGWGTYAKVNLKLPCKLKDVYFIDYCHAKCKASDLNYHSNRFEFFTEEGFNINIYSLDDVIEKGLLNWEDIIVTDFKLSKYTPEYVGHILKLKTNLPRFIFGKDLSPFPEEKENYENYYDNDEYRWY